MSTRYNINPKDIPGEVATKALEFARALVSQSDDERGDKARRIGDTANRLLGRMYNVNPCGDPEA